MNASDITLKQMQQMVHEWITTVGVRYFSPLTNMAILAEETGEVARIMARRHGDQSWKHGENPDLADELADMLWVLTAIANQEGIDLNEAFMNNIRKKSIRDKERHISNPKLTDNSTQTSETKQNTEIMADKYHDSVAKSQVITDDQLVKDTVAKILADKMEENRTHDVMKLLFNCIDLTTLNATDSQSSVARFTERVNDFENEHGDLPNVAAICVYPCFAPVVRAVLDVTSVNIAAVSGGFPSSQTFPEVKVAETALAVEGGADEIDIVLNLGNFLDGDWEEVCDEIQELKHSCREAHLKVILETGALKTAENIRAASILSMYSGADFIKTSTGKGYPGASLEAAYVMCQCIKEYYEQTGRMVGFKPAGGVSTTDEAIAYYTIVKEVLGEKWLDNEYFRIGASRLANNLLSDILGTETKFF